MSSAGISPMMSLPEPVLEIAGRLEAAGFDTWCVGGAVRDWQLGQSDQDVDLATAATPDQVQALFPRTVAVGIKHGTVGVLDRDRRLHEVTTFRRDVTTDGRHAVVEFGVSIEHDLARRDFTINALAWHPFRHELKDPFGGIDDLKAGVVRAVGEPARRFAEDHLRILRMLRFASRFGFAIAPETWQAAQTGAPQLEGLSAERVREEWFKGLETARSVAGLAKGWREAGAARVWLPELYDAIPIAEPVLIRDPVLLTVALCRGPAEVLARLKASNAEIMRAQAISRGPAEPGLDTPPAVRRWLARVGGAADDLISLASLRAGAAPAWASTVAQSRARGEATSRGELALAGADLQGAGVPAGPEMGQLLERMLQAVLDDPGLNTRESLLALVRSWR